MQGNGKLGGTWGHSMCVLATELWFLDGEVGVQYFPSTYRVSSTGGGRGEASPPNSRTSPPPQTD